MDPSTEALTAAGTAAGCIPQRSSEPFPANEPRPLLCHIPAPYYPDRGAECTATWCGIDVLPIQTCSQVPMTFAGGYHYRFDGGGFNADFFFIPVGTGPEPVKENFGWVHLQLLLGETLEPLQRVVVMDVNLEFDAAFDAGLDIVDSTIIGSLKLDPLATGVQGPLYQPSCDGTLDELGNTVPGNCACRFPDATILIPLYVPLGPLSFEEEPSAPPTGARP